MRRTASRSFVLLAIGVACAGKDPDRPARDTPTEPIRTPENSDAYDLQKPDARRAWTVASGPLAVTVERRIAGSIAAIAYGGFQYLDSSKHGRGAAFAYDLDGKQECDNPTEGGSRDDGTISTSSSKLISVDVRGNVLSTVNVPAYWLDRGERSGLYPYCLAHTHGLSKDRVTKTVVVGLPGLPNVMHYQLIWHAARAARQVEMQVPAVAMVPQLTQTLAFDASGRLVPFGGPFRSDVPVVLATSDGAHAAGFFAPRAGQSDGGTIQYLWGHTQGKRAVAMLIPVVDQNRPGAGDQVYGTYMAFGSQDEVRTALQSIMRQVGP
jgi:hypothetical protein